ncbi:MAG: anaerobic glycerol-3-phosphate dehydrogenase subunit B [Lentisphaerae bacterium ADurb.Bin242]|nr:MAG: anaerobic glycerol-3-phosphate dehydrogenase subunit B [Lentisphaerae bacterium ADurb.Bin242]
MFCKKYDVAVCGGGIAGCAAAIAAARRGMKTILMENSVIPGGLATSGVVLVYLPLCDGKGHQTIFGLSEKFLRLSNRYGPADVPQDWSKGGDCNRLQVYFSPASFVLTLDELLSESGTDLWFDTKIIGVETENSRVKRIGVANKSGIGNIEAEVFIDATGDADVAHLAGNPCHLGKNALVSWFVEHRENGRSSEFTFGNDVSTIILADPLPMETTPEGIDGRTVSEFVLRGRERYRKMLADDYRNGMETRKTRYPLVLPTMVPLRHSRCIRGKFVLDTGMAWKNFNDSIGLAPDWRRDGHVWEIPYRTLLPENLKGLLAAGRCISAKEDGWEITRVIPVAAMTGEAAGVAAALSVMNGVSPDELKVSLLQKELKETCGFPLFYEDIQRKPEVQATTKGTCP